jgi:hypothetical protein
MSAHLNRFCKDKDYYSPALTAGKVKVRKNLLASIERHGSIDDAWTYLRLKKDKSSMDKCLKFCFVRNPFARAVSYHRHAIRKHDCQRDFNKWLLNDFPRLASKTYSPLATRVYLDRYGEVGVDYIGRFENLQADYDEACDRIGIPGFKLPHINKGHHLSNYRGQYSQESRDFIEVFFRDELEMFNYAF